MCDEWSVEIVNATDELCEIVPQRDEIVLSWDDRCEVVREADDPAGTYLTHTPGQGRLKGSHARGGSRVGERRSRH